MKTKLLYIIRLLLFMISLSVLAGCGSAGSSEPEGKTDGTDDDTIRIGITFDSFIIERWERDRDIFVSSAKDKGAEVNVQNANGDVEKQKEQIQYFIEKKMDVIVIIAVDSNALSSEVKKAKEEGIKVIAYDRLVMDAPLDLYISFNNETVGKFMADAIIDGIGGSGEILKINGPSKDNNVSLVNKGFDQEIASHDIRVIDTYYASEWKGEEAFNYLSEHPAEAARAQAVMCGNDSLAGQAVRYYSEIRRAGQIPIVGQDADLDACQRIVEGTQAMTVYKPIERLAKKAADCAIELAKGHSVSEQLLTDSDYEVPYLYIEPIMINKDNIDGLIIGSGFHLREDVYLKERKP
ncbi:MAG: substrate-binding domain-containing protein [Lachnospiraceae bacterium]|nr:substrate-binding domain-containing protein [Lachnospiraceae bacterium]